MVRNNYPSTNCDLIDNFPSFVTSFCDVNLSNLSCLPQKPYIQRHLEGEFFLIRYTSLRRCSLDTTMSRPVLPEPITFLYHSRSSVNLESAMRSPRREAGIFTDRLVVDRLSMFVSFNFNVINQTIQSFGIRSFLMPKLPMAVTGFVYFVPLKNINFIFQHISLQN